MKLIKRINLIDNKKLVYLLNILSLPLFFIFAELFTFFKTRKDQPIEGSFDLLDLFLIFLALIGIIVIHELIHGLFFKLFNPKTKVKFGFKKGVAYTTSPNSIYSKRKFLIILLAPFFFVTLSLVLLNSFAVISSIVFVSFASIHAACCIGDFYFCYLVVRTPAKSYVEDTEEGINVYQSHT